MNSPSPLLRAVSGIAGAAAGDSIDQGLLNIAVNGSSEAIRRAAVRAIYADGVQRGAALATETVEAMAVRS
jgi:hypothetical protein